MQQLEQHRQSSGSPSTRTGDFQSFKAQFGREECEWLIKITRCEKTNRILQNFHLKFFWCIKLQVYSIHLHDQMWWWGSQPNCYWDLPHCNLAVTTFHAFLNSKWEECNNKFYIAWSSSVWTSCSITNAIDQTHKRVLFAWKWEKIIIQNQHRGIRAYPRR